ncbi:MAG: HAD family hydrolase [Bacteriovoracia bacterium]
MASPLIKAVIFDLDGTIVDTEPLAARIVKAYYAEKGVALSPEDAQYTNGKKWEVALEYLFKKHPIEVAMEQISHEILTRYQAALAGGVPVVPGVAAAIRNFAQTYPLALVSGSHRRDILFLLEQVQVRECFQVVLGAEDYPRSKPAPDGYLKAMSILGIGPGEAVVFEDSQVGLASAKAAGLVAVAITSTNHFNQSYAQADVRIPDFQGVDRDWLAKLQSERHSIP